MKIIQGLNYQAKLNKMTQDIIASNQPTLVISENTEYIEDLFLQHTDSLFQIEIKSLKTFMKDTLISHEVFNRKTLTHTQNIYLLRKFLKNESFHLFHYANNSYPLLKELEELMKISHNECIEYPVYIDNTLIQQKFDDFHKFYRLLQTHLPQNTYMSLEEASYDYLDESLNNYQIYIIGDYYLTKRQRAFIERMDTFSEVTVIYNRVNNHDVLNNTINLYPGKSVELECNDNDLQKGIIKNLFSQSPAPVIDQVFSMNATHQKEECIKVGIDIKTQIINQNLHFSDFMIIYPEESYKAFLEEVLDNLGLAHNIVHLTNNIYDYSYRLIRDTIPTLDCHNYKEFANSLLQLELDEQYRDYLQTLLFDDPIEPDEFLLFFINTCSFTTSIKNKNADVIQVMSIEEGYCVNEKHIYILGMNETVLPATFKDTSLLLNEDYLYLDHHPLSSIEKLGKHENDILKIFLNPHLSLTVSYANNDLTAKELLPSTLYKSVEKIFSPLHKTVDLNIYKNFLYLNGGQQPSMSINPIIQAFNKYKNHPQPILSTDRLMHHTLSSSRIETYNKCPFSYYLQYGLKIYPRVEKSLQVNEMGSLIHFVLEQCVGTSCSIDDAITQYLDEHLSDKMNDVMNQYFIEEMRKDLTLSLTVINEQLESSSFEIQDREFPIRGKIGDISMNGIIDRVDMFNDFVRIIDYKSSAKDINLNLAMQGFNIQMLLYLEMLSHNEGYRRGAVNYINMKKRKLVLSESIDDSIDLDKLLKEYKMGGYVIDDGDHAMISASPEEIIPVSFVKTKGIYKGQVLNSKQLDILTQHICDHLTNLYTDIHQGCIDIKPSYSDNSSINAQVYPCTYCPYKSICMYDVFYNDTKDIEMLDVDKILGGEADESI